MQNFVTNRKQRPRLSDVSSRFFKGKAKNENFSLQIIERKFSFLFVSKINILTMGI